MTGGCERKLRKSAWSVSTLYSLAASVPALGGRAALGGERRDGAGAAGSGFDSWHLFFCQASSASFDCPRSAM